MEIEGESWRHRERGGERWREGEHGGGRGGGWESAWASGCMKGKKQPNQSLLDMRSPSQTRRTTEGKCLRGIYRCFSELLFFKLYRQLSSLTNTPAPSGVCQEQGAPSLLGVVSSPIMQWLFKASQKANVCVVWCGDSGQLQTERHFV